MAIITLTVLLEIVASSLTPDERRGLTFAEEIYRMRGSPTEPKALIAVLKEIVQECTKRNMRYGRALYQKLKWLERGEWMPRVVEASPAVTARARSEEALIAEAQATYTPEEFASWMRTREVSKRIEADSDKSVIPIEKRRKAYG